MGKIIRHPHYIYNTKQKPRSSHDIPINTKLKDKVNVVQKFRHTIKKKVFKKQILKNI